jgi:gliding motility-associated-like protein
MNLKNILFVILFLVNSVLGYSQFIVNAGNDKMLCPGESYTLGGSPSATGGLPPYSYSWSPNIAISSTNTSNPTCTSTGFVEYTLTVVDDTGAVKTDKVIVYINNIYFTDAGKDTSICENSSAVIGNTANINYPGLTYSWSPALTLSSSTAPRPISTPGIITTTYTLTVTSSGCPNKTDQVTVNVIPTPNIDAGADVTIYEGENVTLQATGGNFYVWNPQNTLTYPYTANPDAEPVISTTYTVSAADPSKKCYNSDTVRVTVIRSDEIEVYNTITPNGDGNNDVWYIGNIYKYPNSVLELYNRYGKLVYRTSPYVNDFGGTVSGQELPAATYFYEINLGDGKGKKNGTLTIVR